MVDSPCFYVKLCYTYGVHKMGSVPSAITKSPKQPDGNVITSSTASMVALIPLIIGCCYIRPVTNKSIALDFLFLNRVLSRGVPNGLSRLRLTAQERFLGGRELATTSGYPTFSLLDTPSLSLSTRIFKCSKAGRS